MEEVLVKMKRLLKIDSEDESEDEWLLHVYERAKQTILQYCNVRELPDHYAHTYMELAFYFYKHRQSMGLQRRREGERTFVYEEGIPSYIKASLPLPRIQVGGYHV